MLEVKTVEDFLDKISTARIAGDAAALTDLFHDAAEFRIQGLSEPVKGSAAIGDALRGLVEAYEFTEYKTLALLIEGNRVATRRAIKVRHRASGQVAETESAEFLTFEDGKLVSFIQYVDTALALAIAQPTPAH